MTLSIEAAISKYSEGDDAYANKLKLGIREAMGYSNYKAQLGNEISTPAARVSIKGKNITPQGVIAGQNSAYGIQNANIGALQKVTGAIDSAAGSLAASQASARRSGSGQTTEGFGNAVAFKANDELDSRILGAMQDPYNYNEDGTRGDKKSLQQIESELNQYFNARPDMNMVSFDGQGNMVKRSEITADQIKQRITERVPSDYIGNEGKYMLMSKGYSEKVAKNAADVIDYSTSSEPEKLVMQTAHPELMQEFQKADALASLSDDATAKKTDPNGNQAPAYTYSELKQRHPDMTESEFKKFALPPYEKDLQESIGSYMNVQGPDGNRIVDTLIAMPPDTEKKKDYYDTVTASPEFNNIVNRLYLISGDAFSKSDIEFRVLRYIQDNKK